MQRRLFRRVALVTAAVCLGWAVVGVVSEARLAKEKWGPSTEVVVLDVDVELGDVVGVEDLVTRSHPLALLPQDAVLVVPTEPDVAVRSLRQGEVLTRRDLRSTRESTTLPEGRRAVSIPTDATIPRLEPGDLVDLFLVTDRFGAADVDVAAGQDVPALVVEVDAAAVVLAIDAERVGAVVATLATGRIVIAKR